MCLRVFSSFFFFFFLLLGWLFIWKINAHFYYFRNGEDASDGIRGEEIHYFLSFAFLTSKLLSGKNEIIYHILSLRDPLGFLERKEKRVTLETSNILSSFIGQGLDLQTILWLLHETVPVRNVFNKHSSTRHNFVPKCFLHFFLFEFLSEEI